MSANTIHFTLFPIASGMVYHAKLDYQVHNTLCPIQYAAKIKSVSKPEKQCCHFAFYRLQVTWWVDVNILWHPVNNKRNIHEEIAILCVKYMEKILKWIRSNMDSFVCMKLISTNIYPFVTIILLIYYNVWHTYCMQHKFEHFGEIIAFSQHVNHFPETLLTLSLTCCIGSRLRISELMLDDSY